MARQIINEHGGSSIGFVSALNALRKKLKICWLQPKSQSTDFSCASNGIFRSWPESSTAFECDEGMLSPAGLFIWIGTQFYENVCMPIDDLISLGIVLNVFEDVHDVIGARARIYEVIAAMNKTLRALVVGENTITLSDEESDNQYVILPENAYIAAGHIDEHAGSLLYRATSPRLRFGFGGPEKCCAMSLVFYHESEHLMTYEYPNLALLYFQSGNSTSVPVEVFKGMKELRVLYLNIPSLQHSLTLPRNLRMLHLKVRKLKDLSAAIGDLINLEFLFIHTLCLSDIPREMGELAKIRYLNLSKMNLAHIPPKVLSRMLKLEELYLPLSFKMWGCTPNEEHNDEWENDSEENINAIDDGERINTSLHEIESLSLNALQFSVANASMLPAISKNVTRFRIHVSNVLKDQLFHRDSFNELRLTGDAYDIKERGIWDLTSRAKDLALKKVRNLKNITNQLGDNGFPLLTNMLISECDELECLFDTTEPKRIASSSFCELKILHLSMLSNLKEIWHGVRPYFPWLKSLRRINISFCHKLKYVFPLSIARSLTQLQSIEILDCKEIEEIFYGNKKYEYEVCSIEELHLYSLPKLVGFMVQKGKTNQPFTTNEIVSNSLDGPINASDCNFPATSVHRWRNKLIPNKKVLHSKLGCAFSFKIMERSLGTLKKLKIAFCNALKVIFSFNGNHATVEVLNCLEVLELHGLQNLEHIWFQIPQRIVAFQNLQVLILSECHNLYVLSLQVAKLLVQLQKIQISRCEKMEEIVAKDDEIDKFFLDKLVFTQLRALELQYMPNLRIFYGGICAIELPVLEYLKLNQCNKMESFTNLSLNTPMLERVQINGSTCSLKGDLNATIRGAKL